MFNARASPTNSTLCSVQSPRSDYKDLQRVRKARNVRVLNVIVHELDQPLHRNIDRGGIPNDFFRHRLDLRVIGLDKWRRFRKFAKWTLWYRRRR